MLVSSDQQKSKMAQYRVATVATTADGDAVRKKGQAILLVNDRGQASENFVEGLGVRLAGAQEVEISRRPVHMPSPEREKNCSLENELVLVERLAESEQKAFELLKFLTSKQ